MATTSNKRKKAVAATIAAAAILLAGTFAWTSISQIALNESAGIVNVGGRLHDDFNGENKDIYVENFTDPLDGGQPIYARVRLDEYMEVGQDAGGYGEDVDEDGIVEATPVVAGTDVNNVDSWTTHIPTESCTECTTGETCKIHAHWEWEMGGQTTYMPTFNKDKDSLDAEINGTYEGTAKGDTVHYDDYVAYEESDTLDGNASYDDDTNTIDDDVVWTQPETHTAKKTASGTVIPMSQWIEEGEQPGPYWVYDTDGWAYWAQPIMPGEATGLLLSSIDMTKNPGEKCYYGINVVGQFATVSDWEYFEEGGKPSEDAERLLEEASQHVPKVSVVNVNGDTTLAPGESAEFTATTSVGTLTGYAAGDFEWNVYNEDLSVSQTSTITDNGDGSATLTVGENEQHKNLIVAAKSTDDAYAGAVGLSSVTIETSSGDGVAPAIQAVHNRSEARTYVTISDIAEDDYPLSVKYYHLESPNDSYPAEPFMTIENLRIEDGTVVFDSNESYIEITQDVDGNIVIGYQTIRNIDADHYLGISVEDCAGNRSELEEGVFVLLPTGCFAAGTQVATVEGLKNIEDVQLGDMVYSVNMETGKKELAEITWVQEYRVTPDTYTIYAAGETIVTTYEHPFYVEGKGWVAAEKLVEGDVLKSMNGSQTVIEKIVYEKLDTPLQVYNFTVEGNHNYLVSEAELLVHNVQK